MRDLAHCGLAGIAAIVLAAGLTAAPPDADPARSGIRLLTPRFGSPNATCAPRPSAVSHTRNSSGVTGGHSFRLATAAAPAAAFAVSPLIGCGDERSCGEPPCVGINRQNRPQTYVSFGTGLTWLSGDSFGFNTLGGFSNWQQDADQGYSLSGAIGRRTPFEIRGRQLAVRTEVQGTDYHDYGLVTDGFPGAPGPTAFHYRVNAGDVRAVSTNVWLDIPVRDRVEVYLGGGIGASQHQLTVHDTVVAGYAHDTDVMTLFGLGVNVHLSERITLDLGYRLTDLGSAKVPLRSIGGNVPSGNYELDLETDELTANLRVALW